MCLLQLRNSLCMCHSLSMFSSSPLPGSSSLAPSLAPRQKSSPLFQSLLVSLNGIGELHCILVLTWREELAERKRLASMCEGSDVEWRGVVFEIGSGVEKAEEAAESEGKEEAAVEAA